MAQYTISSVVVAKEKIVQRTMLEKRTEHSKHARGVREAIYIIYLKQGRGKVQLAGYLEQTNLVTSSRDLSNHINSNEGSSSRGKL